MRANVIWLTALAMAMLTPSAAFAQDFSFTSYRDIEAAYQGQHAEIESLRASLATLESTVAATDPQGGTASLGRSV